MKVQATKLMLGDVVRTMEGGYADATVKRIDDDGTVHLFRPYVNAAGFSYVGGVICYIGIEEYEITPRTMVERIEKGRPLL